MRTFLVAALAMAILLPAIAGASYVNITEPFNATIQQNGSIYLGKVGQGQTFYITISAETSNSSGRTYNIGWDELYA